MNIMGNKEIDNNVINKIFGNIIQDFRLKNNLTQEQLAEKIGISTKYMSKIETGIRGLSSQKLIKCMNILAITPNTLYKKLINNNSMLKQLELAEEINSLPDDKLEFIIKIIKDMKELR